MDSLPIPVQATPATRLTSHAILVPWGLFAQRIGLIKALELSIAAREWSTMGETA